MKTRIYEDKVSLYKLWRDTRLGKLNSAFDESRFLVDVLSKKPAIKSVLDLGGGIGLHSSMLAQNDFQATIFDQSISALKLASEASSQLDTINGSFETINLDASFDASICMWSSLTYVLEETGRRNFYDWISQHTRYLVVLDQSNFYLQPPLAEDICQGKDSRYELKVTRKSTMTPEWRRHTDYIYEVYHYNSSITEKISDQEIQDYLSVEQLKSYLGNRWELTELLGDYDLKAKYDRNTSSRMITIFIRKD